MYWLCYENPQGVFVLLQPASSLVEARLRASMADLDIGEFQEGHLLIAKMVRRIPKNMIGKRLSQIQAARLLSTLERGRKRA